MIAVGDMMFDTSLGLPRVFFYHPESAACLQHFRSSFPIPFINTEENRQWLSQQGVSLDGLSKTSHAAQSIALKLPTEATAPDYPFRLIRADLAQSDLVFGNLECPLSNRGRPIGNDGCYRASPAFAQALAASNFKVVSFSNNHCMDYGETAFLDTIRALRRTGIEVIGAGRSYEEARKPALLEIRGIRLAFLAYNMFGPDSVYALPGESGVVPLNALVVKEDVDRIRSQVDFIIVSVHWGLEGESRPRAGLVELAHQLVDHGVDVILGHHPHLPGSIEIYKSKLIFYSLGNFIFGHSHRYWIDNMMVKLTLDRDHCRRAEFIPIGIKGIEQYQPKVLSGEQAEKLIEFVRVLSEPFGTSVTFNKGRGIIGLQSVDEAKIA
jgi:poly-gamma-glutamate synthesis protein (capsule biosynthesis protein)